MATFTIKITDTESGGISVEYSIKRTRQDGKGVTNAENVGLSLANNWSREELRYFAPGADIEISES